MNVYFLYTREKASVNVLEHDKIKYITTTITQ